MRTSEVNTTTRGVIRNVDSQGRLVIPKEYRILIGVENGDPVEMIPTEAGVLVRKPKNICVFCGDQTNEDYRGVHVCLECTGNIATLISYNDKEVNQ